MGRKPIGNSKKNQTNVLTPPVGGRTLETKDLKEEEEGARLVPKRKEGGGLHYSTAVNQLRNIGKNATAPEQRCFEERGKN